MNAAKKQQDALPFEMGKLVEKDLALVFSIRRRGRCTITSYDFVGSIQPERLPCQMSLLFGGKEDSVSIT
jgi:hypothetical protein